MNIFIYTKKGCPNCTTAKQMLKARNLKFIECDIVDRAAMTNLFAGERPQCVINLAAQPGVRYSLLNPASYIDSNLVGFGNLLECCRKFNIEHFIFASSSSVYGEKSKTPFNEKKNRF
jgi:UDP-glucuronate 4-epimerase